MTFYYKYDNSVSITEVKNKRTNESVGFFNSLEEIIESVKSPHISNISTRFYTYDPRISKKVYIVTANIGEHKNKFVCYYIKYEQDELEPDKIFKDPLYPTFVAKHAICLGCGRDYYNILMTGVPRESPVILNICVECFRDKVKEMRNERVKRKESHKETQRTTT